MIKGNITKHACTILVTCFFLHPNFSAARNVYLFKQNDVATINAKISVNQQRKVFFFDNSLKAKPPNNVPIVNHASGDNVIVSNHPIRTSNKKPEVSIIESSSVGLSAAYRNGNLDWNKGFGPNSTLPNILSELEWNDIQMTQFSFNGDMKFKNGLTVGLDFGVGVIADGDGRDSDYLADNRQQEFSRSTFKVGGHEVIDVSGHIGYSFPLDIVKIPNSSITPLFGFSYHAQNIQFEDGIQVVSNSGFSVPVGTTLTGLDSEYRTNWYGPWLGFEYEFKKDLWSFSTQYSHHWADYEADATWNLRQDFAQPVSFEHITKGEGDRISITATRYWLDDWHASLNVGLEKWSTDAGVDRIFFSNGNISTLQFNEANWDSWWIGLGVKRYF